MHKEFQKRIHNVQNITAGDPRQVLSTIRLEKLGC